MTQSTTGLVEFKPCPFCGGNKIQVFEADDIGGWLAGCCAQTWGDTEADAITAWNTRPTDPTIAELVAALEKWGCRGCSGTGKIIVTVNGENRVEPHLHCDGTGIDPIAQTALTKSRSAL